MLAKGGTLILHGYTHQLGEERNPNDGQGGQDYEFLRVHYSAQHAVVYDGAPARNAAAWTRHRIGMAFAAIREAGLPRPEFWQFPEYGGSPAEFRVAASEFLALDRSQQLRAGMARPGQAADPHRAVAAVSRPGRLRWPVLPETLGFIARPGERASGSGSVRFLLAVAAAQKAAVRDNVASFYYHPFLGTDRCGASSMDSGMKATEFASTCAALRG